MLYYIYKHKMDIWFLASALIVILSSWTCECAQEFYQQPTNQSAVQGSTVVLRCIVKNRKGTVQWTKGMFGLGMDRNLPGYDRYTMIGSTTLLDNSPIDEYSLRIEMLELQDDDVYMCQVSATNDEVAIVSEVAAVNVLIPPDPPVLKGGLTIPAIRDEPTNITCEVLNGKPKSTVSWKKDGVPITENTYEIATLQADKKRVDTFGIVSITASATDAGKKIECGAWNEAMKDQPPMWTQATLDVQYKPIVRLTHSNPDMTMKEYDDVKFKCSWEANPYEITWKWYRNDEIIPNSNSDILKIPRISRDYHGDIIKCEATNSVGSTVKTHSMNILYGPKFKNEPKHVSADNGNRAELSCEADGNPTAEIKWYRQGKYTLLHTGSLYVIPKVRDGQFGVYTCTATVLGFNEISRDIYVTENGPPEIISDATQYAKQGEDAMIQCMSVSSPQPIFIWSRNGQPIDYASSGRFSAPEQGLPYGGKSNLKILNTQPEDFTVYNCTVTNGKGIDTLMITLAKSEELPLALIIGCAAGGVAVIFAIVIALVIYQRCKHTDNESYAETDSNTEIRKRDKNESPSEMTKSTLMDQWRQDYNYRYSADFDDIDSKAKTGHYGGIDTERYGTMPTNYTNGHMFGDHHNDDLGPLNRFENSYSTGYIPSTFRSPSRTDFNTTGRINTNDINSGRVSANDFTSGRVSANDFPTGRVSTTDFSGRLSTEPLEPFRLPAADFTTTKLATNV